jgi:hypothetical protein
MTASHLSSPITSASEHDIAIPQTMCRHHRARILLLATANILASFASTALSLDFIPEAFRSVLLGTQHGDEMGVAVAVDAMGNTYVAGITTSVSDDATKMFGDRLMTTSKQDGAQAGNDATFDLRELGNSIESNASNRTNEGYLKLDKPTNEATADIFLCKINKNGIAEWVRRFGSSRRTDSVTSIEYRHGVVYGTYFSPLPPDCYMIAHRHI